MKKVMFFFALLLPMLTWSQSRVSQAYLGPNGEVLTRDVVVDSHLIPAYAPSTINQMAGFPEKVPAHPNFKNFRNVTLADINGDGKEEILVALFGSAVTNGDFHLVSALAGECFIVKIKFGRGITA